MLVWLASYPRSGNTLLRILMNRCFGVETLSLYDDQFGDARDDVFAKVVAHRKHGLSQQEIRAQAAADPKQVYLKTHGLPDDKSKAIYVIRDGRASVVSYWHYLREVEKADVSLEDVVAGRVWAGSWSNHVAHWALTWRPDTLVLRYENLCGAPERATAQIADFLGLPAPAAAKVDFAELQAAMPQFFRRGANSANLSELQGAELDLFWQLHGDIMGDFSYGPAPQ